MQTIYFDNSATTKIDETVFATMLPYLKENYGNPSSIYKIGRENKKAIEESREKVAKALNCNPQEIYFTSCGSESDNTALKGIAKSYKSKGNHIITSKIEHPAILETCRQLEHEGFEVSYINVDKNGVINLQELEAKIRPTTTLISIMSANNEIGTIEPIAKIGEIAKKNNIIFHTDSVQAIGSLNIDVQKMNIDSLSLSAHKFYGPKGIGALYVRKGINFTKFMNGGHQENNKRAGTENVAGIVGLGKAIELAYKSIIEHTSKIKALRDYYEDQIIKKIPNIKINGNIENRLPGNSNISFEGVSGESLLLNLDLKGIYASMGSACSSGAIQSSHVLSAIGLPEKLAKSSLRISIGKYNTKEEVDFLVQNLVEIVTRLRNLSSN